MSGEINNQFLTGMISSQYRKELKRKEEDKGDPMVDADAPQANQDVEQPAFAMMASDANALMMMQEVENSQTMDRIASGLGEHPVLRDQDAWEGEVEDQEEGFTPVISQEFGMSSPRLSRMLAIQKVSTDVLGDVNIDEAVL